MTEAFFLSRYIFHRKTLCQKRKTFFKFAFVDAAVVVMAHESGTRSDELCQQVFIYIYNVLAKNHTE